MMLSRFLLCLAMGLSLMAAPSFAAQIKNETLNAKPMDIQIANHYSAAVWVKIYHNSVHYHDAYISPYKKLELIQVPEGNYTLEIYDLARKLLGYISEDFSYKARKHHSLISINRFSFKPAIDGELRYPDDAELAGRPRLAASVKRQMEEASETKAKQSKRAIKIANLTDYLLEISIGDAGSWTIGNDIYTPEFLKSDDKLVEIKSDDLLKVKVLETKSDKLHSEFTKKAEELKLDKDDNYIWIVDGLPQP